MSPVCGWSRPKSLPFRPPRPPQSAAALAAAEAALLAPEKPHLPQPLPPQESHPHRRVAALAAPWWNSRPRPPQSLAAALAATLPQGSQSVAHRTVGRRGDAALPSLHPGSEQACDDAHRGHDQRLRREVTTTLIGSRGSEARVSRRSESPTELDRQRPQPLPLAEAAILDPPAVTVAGRNSAAARVAAGRTPPQP